ncbi:tyrosine-type recombinase/integrase [Rhodococcus hoagii]|nr:tyrosine-type recombinase/integrase [Prescottella equi]NKV87161.1 tyrosine-type recombinase/integrase [Prescottella equi]
MYVWPGPATKDATYGTAPMSWGRDFYLKWRKTAVAKAGLLVKLRVHDLRHTCAALLIAANVPAKAIQAHLGHSSFKIKMDTYGHLYEDASDHVANAMNAAFAAAGHRIPRMCERSGVKSRRGTPHRWSDGRGHRRVLGNLFVLALTAAWSLRRRSSRCDLGLPRSAPSRCR